MEKSYVAMEQKLCAICGNVHDSGAILLHKSLHKNLNPKTLTGYDRCEECKKKIDENYIALIEVSNEPIGDTMKQTEANRTGVLVWIRKHAFDEIFNVKSDTPMAFVQPDVVKYLQSLIPTE